jgi:hypothetical protein
MQLRETFLILIFTLLWMSMTLLAPVGNGKPVEQSKGIKEHNISEAGNIFVDGDQKPFLFIYTLKELSWNIKYHL